MLGIKVNYNGQLKNKNKTQKPSSPYYNITVNGKEE